MAIANIDLAVQSVQPSSILEEAFNNVGDGFQEIMDKVETMNAKGGDVTVQDALSLQQSTFHYSMYQEMVTKIASKSASAINDVMKAQ